MGILDRFQRWHRRQKRVPDGPGGDPEPPSPSDFAVGDDEPLSRMPGVHLRKVGARYYTLGCPACGSVLYFDGHDYRCRNPRCSDACSTSKGESEGSSVDWASEHNRLWEEATALLNPHTHLADRPDSEPSPDKFHDLQEGISLLARILERDPTHWPSLFFQGKAFQALGQRRLAYESFKRAYSLQPDNVDIARELCLECSALGFLDENASVASHAVSIKPEDAGLHSNLALALLLVGDDDRASAEADAGVRLAPDDPVCHNVRQLVEDVRTGKKARPARLDA